MLFGHGRKQRRIQAAETDRTSAIAESIAQDKEMTRLLLRAVGVPTPYGRPVKDADDAWEAAEDIGVPVVVKPQDGNQGRGVATNLTTREQVVRAYEAARKEGESVLVEKFAPGHDYRLLVVGDRVVAAARREPAQVIGDGVHTVAQLIEQVNADPRRGEHHATVLSKIKLDAIALAVLADQGLTPDVGSGRGHGGADPPQCELEHRRHGHRRHRARPSGRGRRGRRCRQDRRPGHRRRGRGGPRHLPAAGRAGRRDRRSQRRAGPADAPRAFGGHLAARSARRSSISSSPRARTAAFPSSPSPASTAKRPPRASSPTSSAARASAWA